MLLIENIQSLLGIETDTRRRYVRGAEMQQLPQLQNAYLWMVGDRIADFGPMDTLPDEYKQQADQRIDATGRLVLPCWCDLHTHIVYAGSREQEFLLRLKGATYEEIAQAGGGILNSAKRLQQTSFDELFDAARQRLFEVQEMGTGAIEIKSGYGLTTEAELKMLRVIKALKEDARQLIKATFLGAHAIPTEYKHRRHDYIRLLTDEMLPQIAAEGLADFIDVFCDRGFFTVDETAEILEAGAKYGLRAKIHANELDYSGGVQVGAAHNALSVDHLECMGEAEINALLPTDTMPTLLPSTAFFLRLPYAPARKLIDFGLARSLGERLQSRLKSIG